MLNYLASKILPPTDPPSSSDILTVLGLIFRTEAANCSCFQYPRFKELVEVYKVAQKNSNPQHGIADMLAACSKPELWILCKRARGMSWKKVPSIIQAGKVAEELLFAYSRVDTDAALKKMFPDGNALGSQDPLLEEAEAADAEEYFDAEDRNNSLQEDPQLLEQQLEGIKLGPEEQKLQVKKQVQPEEATDCTHISLDAGGGPVCPLMAAAKEDTKRVPAEIVGSKVDLVADTDEDWEQVRGQGECTLEEDADDFVWIGTEEQSGLGRISVFFCEAHDQEKVD